MSSLKVIRQILDPGPKAYERYAAAVSIHAAEVCKLLEKSGMWQSIAEIPFTRFQFTPPDESEIKLGDEVPRTELYIRVSLTADDQEEEGVGPGTELLFGLLDSWAGGSLWWLFTRPRMSRSFISPGPHSNWFSLRVEYQLEEGERGLWPSKIKMTGSPQYLRDLIDQCNPGRGPEKARPLELDRTRKIISGLSQYALKRRNQRREQAEEADVCYQHARSTQRLITEILKEEGVDPLAF